MSEADYIPSSRRANLVEHLFIGELLRYLWCAGYHDVDVLHAETDANGYDVVIDANSVIRHIQIKSCALTAKTRIQKVPTELWRKPCGCVIWVRFDPESMSIGPYRWYGARPGRSLVEISSPIALPRTTNINSYSKNIKTEHNHIRAIYSSEFDKVDSIAELVERLFDISPQNL